MTMRPAKFLVLALVLGVLPHPARADLVVISPDPAYLAPIVDKLRGREHTAGAHRGILLDQRVTIPDLETPYDQVLAEIASYDTSAAVGYLAIIPAMALPDGPVPGDLFAPTWIAREGDDRVIPMEEDRIRAARLAGAEAGFFEVPDVRAAKRPAVRRPAVVAGGVISRAGGGVPSSNANAAATDRDGHATALVLSKLGHRWAIIEPILADAGDKPDSVLTQRSYDNVSRLLLNYLKSIPAPTRPPIPSHPPRPPKGQVALRQSPTADGAVVGYFPRGTRYQVLETLPGEDWQRIRLVGMAGEGWASRVTLEREPLVVYGLANWGGAEVLTPREYNMDPEFATPTNVARAICSPDDKRIETRDVAAVRLCAGIDSMETVADSIIVYLGPASKALFREGPPQEAERFLAKLVYTLTENPRFKVVRLTFTTERNLRILRREDFLPYWPSADLSAAAEGHADSAIRERARSILSGRR